MFVCWFHIVFIPAAVCLFLCQLRCISCTVFWPLLATVLVRSISNAQMFMCYLAANGAMHQTSEPCGTCSTGAAAAAAAFCRTPTSFSTVSPWQMSLRMWETILSLTLTCSSCWILASFKHCRYWSSASVIWWKHIVTLPLILLQSFSPSVLQSWLWSDSHLILGFVFGLAPLVQSFKAGGVVQGLSGDRLGLFQLFAPLEVLMTSLFHRCYRVILNRDQIWTNLFFHSFIGFKFDVET